MKEKKKLQLSANIQQSCRLQKKKVLRSNQVENLKVVLKYKNHAEIACQTNN